MKKKNTILILAAILVILLGATAYWLSTNGYGENLVFTRELKQIEKQSSSDEVEAIEKDLLETDLSGIDKELEDIEAELDAAY